MHFLGHVLSHSTPFHLSRGWLALAVCALAGLVGPDSAQAQRPIGVDVSSYQGGSINWSSVKGDGVSFAWAKATEGQTVDDSTFSGNISRGKAAGVYMGAYHYAHPELHSPSIESSHFWSIAGGTILADGKTLMPMLDMEEWGGHVGATSFSDWANDWCADIVAAAAANGVKVKPAIYVSACNGCYFNSSVSQWYSDIADYNGGNIYTGTPWTTCTSCEVWGSGVWHFWQVSSTAAIAGISGGVDLDGYNGTLSGLQSTMLATAATSAIYYWDPQGTSGANPYTGSMNGTWENSKWSTSSSGQATPTGWVEGKAACFGVHTGLGTPAFTNTMNSSHVVAGFFDGALAPNSCNVTIKGSGVITLASGPQALDVHNSSDGSLGYLTIENVIAGAGQLVPEDNGQSYLNGVNTYSGGTQLGFQGNDWNGIVNFNNGSSFGTGPISVWSSGGALVVEGSSAVTIPNDFTFIWTNAAPTLNLVGNPAGVTFSGDFALGSKTATLGSGGGANNLVSISGVISGAGGLTKFNQSNAGTLQLTGVNTYTGNTIIGAGTLTIGGAGCLGSGSYSKAIANSGVFNYNSSASQTFSGVISGTGALSVNGTGVLVLSGVNTYTGTTTINSGSVVQITADSGLGATSSALTLNGGCLKNNNSAPILSASRTITLGTKGGYLDAGWAPSNPLTVNSKLTGAGRLFINQDGSPVVLANTGNNYTGDTIIGTNGPGYYASGTQALLKLGASGVIPNGSGKGNVTINQPYHGILDVAGFTQTINGLSGDGLVTNSTGTGSLTVCSNNQSSTFSGVIAGALVLTKGGSGVLTLTGDNTYTGATTVSAGTLALGDGGSLGATTVTVASTAKLASLTTNECTLGGTTTLSSGAFASFTGVGGDASIVGHISVTGNLNLNANALTITVSGPALAPGTYRLLDCTGTLSGAANTTPNFNGTPLDSGCSASIATVPGSAGHVDLVIKTSHVFSNLAASQAVVYGASSVLLGGNVSAPGPLYPALGETISITINGNTQTTAINDSTGDFSLAFNLAGLPANSGGYPITYSYAGNAVFNPASDASTTLTINSRPAALTGTRPYDGTTGADASILTVTNTLGSDVVTVASGSATLAGANVGSQSITSFDTLTLGGPAAGNYTLTGASGAVTITAPSFSILDQHVDDTGTNFVLTWQSAPGATYYVLGTTNLVLDIGSWTNVVDPIMATDTTSSVTIPMTWSMGLFEVKSQ